MEEQNDDGLAMETKRAMATAALFTTIIKQSIENNKCQNIPDSNADELEQFANEVLDHIIIVGGFPRDVLLERKINDIDIILNLRELCKLQSNHLKKYHSKRELQDRSCRCLYWQRYLNKFQDANEKKEEERAYGKAEMEAMHDLNYILNGKYFLEILTNHHLLQNKLSAKDHAAHGWFDCEIVNSVNFNNIDLDGQCLDIIDTFNPSTCYEPDMDGMASAMFHRKSRQLSISGMDIFTNNNNNTQSKSVSSSNHSSIYGNSSGGSNNVSASNDSQPTPQSKKGGRHGRIQSMQLVELDMSDMGNEYANFGMQGTKSRQEYITIEIPVYSGKLRQKLLHYDFTINALIIPFSNILKLQFFNNIDEEETERPDMDDDRLSWIDIVENGLEECNSTMHCVDQKLLTVPNMSHEAGVIESHPITFHFFRILRWMIRAPDFNIDAKLIDAHVNDYQRWVVPQWFEKEQNRNKFMERLRFTLEKECKSVGDVEQMIKTLKIMKFDKMFLPLVDESPMVRHTLIDTMSTIQNENIVIDEMMQLFSRSGFPIEQTVFRLASAATEELNSLKQTINFLESELGTKNGRITDLEKQNDRLLKEIGYLTVHTSNDKVKELEKSNNNLLQVLQRLEEEKKVLAVNVNQQIDELRGFMSSYQKLAK